MNQETTSISSQILAENPDIKKTWAKRLTRLDIRLDNEKELTIRKPRSRIKSEKRSPAKFTTVSFTPGIAIPIDQGFKFFPLPTLGKHHITRESNPNKPRYSDDYKEVVTEWNALIAEMWHREY